MAPKTKSPKKQSLTHKETFGTGRSRRIFKKGKAVVDTPSSHSAVDSLMTLLNYQLFNAAFQAPGRSQDAESLLDAIAHVDIGKPLARLILNDIVRDTYKYDARVVEAARKALEKAR